MLLLIPDDQPEKLKIIGDFAPLVAPVRIGRPTSVNLGRLLAALDDAQAPLRHGGQRSARGRRQGEAQGHRRRRRAADPQDPSDRRPGERAGPHPSAESALPRLRQELPAAAGQPRPPPDRPRRRAAGASGQVRQRQRALPAADPSRRRHLGPRRRAALRQRPSSNRSRRHGNADHHLRGAAPDGARLPAGYDLRDRAGHPRHRADAATVARDGAGAPAARPRAHVGVRAHVLLRSAIQHGERLRAPADPGRRRGVRPEHRDALSWRAAITAAR